MVRLGHLLVTFVLITSLLLTSCAQQDNLDLTIHDPVRALRDKLQLSDGQLEIVLSGTGTLQLTPEQVDTVREPVEHLLTELEPLLDETRWNEVRNTFETMLSTGEADMEALSQVAQELFALEVEPGVQVVTWLEKISEEPAHSEERQPLTTESTEVTTVYLPAGTPEGIGTGEEEINLTWTWGDKIGFGEPDYGAVANPETGGVFAYSRSWIGSDRGTALLGVEFDVLSDNTDVSITTTIKHVTATVSIGAGFTSTSVAKIFGEYWGLRHKVIDPILGWDSAVKLICTVLGAFLKPVKIACVVADGGIVAINMLSFVNLAQALLEMEESEEQLHYTTGPLDSGRYRFYVGMHARSSGAAIGYSHAAAYGQVTQIEVTQNVQEEPVTPEYTPMVAASWGYTMGLKSDGTVIAVGRNEYGQCDVGGWTSIIQVSAGGPHTAGLKSDGTVVAVGHNDYGQSDIGGWTNTVQVAAGGWHSVGLKSDSSVQAVGDNTHGQCGVGGWESIVQVAAGDFHTVGLKSEGTVVAVGFNHYGQCVVGNWTHIVQVAAGGYHTVGLKSDGTVVAVGDNRYGQCDVNDWTDIVQISAGGFHTVGLKSDGTVVAVGRNDYGECELGGWTQIVQVAAGGFHTVGLTPDGMVVSVGRNDYGQCDVGDWNLL